MARRPKQGLDYAGWSVNIFDGDTKIDKLLDARGWVGFSIYFYLCQMAYKYDGYFYRWDYDDAANTARRMGGGVSSATVKETVAYCLQIALFDERTFVEWHVLTSRGIQRRYCEAIQSRRVKTVLKDLWLLNENESMGLDLCVANENLQPANSDLQQANADLQPANAPKRKGKYRKVLCSDSADAEPNPPLSPPTRHYEHDEIPYMAARYLARRIHKNFPAAKKTPESTLQKWADTFRLLNEVDGYDEDLISDVLAWSQDNEFWRKNVLSAEKFRKQFLRLLAESGLGDD